MELRDWMFKMGKGFLALYFLEPLDYYVEQF